METTFTDAAFTALLACETDPPLREALEHATYHAAHRTWRVQVTPAQEEELVMLLRQDSDRKTTQTAPPNAPACSTLSDLLPGLPEDEPERGGYRWIDRLFATGWYTVGLWGANGWELGNRPHQIMAHCDLPQRGVYGLATYVAGDTTAEAFASREERDAATDEIAVRWWIANGDGPEGLTPGMSPVPALYRGPYNRWRTVPPNSSAAGELPVDHASALLDQARADETVSGEAMRWIPDS
ncbi:hypothetical protein [Streptomyces rimosus]|uniref:hypothetical protein n=1 Tax=Streptomyces rimosus TaxID=1927 RepID=UPI0004C0BD54|nr:hypothetical protein [Streptomyces rimosus]